MNNFKFEKEQKEIFEKLNNVSFSLVFKILNGINWVTSPFIKRPKLILIIIFGIILINVLIFLSSKESNSRYDIRTQNGVVYSTNKIELKDGCIYFKEINDVDEIIICGGFTIIKNN